MKINKVEEKNIKNKNNSIDFFFKSTDKFSINVLIIKFCLL